MLHMVMEKFFVVRVGCGVETMVRESFHQVPVRADILYAHHVAG